MSISYYVLHKLSHMVRNKCGYLYFKNQHVTRHMFCNISCTAHYSPSQQHVGAHITYVTSVLPAKSYINTFFDLTIVATNKTKFHSFKFLIHKTLKHYHSFNTAIHFQNGCHILNFPDCGNIDQNYSFPFRCG